MTMSPRPVVANATPVNCFKPSIISRIFLLPAFEAVRRTNAAPMLAARQTSTTAVILKEAHWLSLHSAIPRKRAAASKRSS
jgi:hypothetical protein